jgi:hypothetical protein
MLQLLMQRPDLAERPSLLLPAVALLLVACVFVLLVRR